VREETLSVHGHEYFDEEYGVFIPPIYLSAIFEQKIPTRQSRRGTELKYSREENPTVYSFEKIIAKLEKGFDALAFNSGMSSISATLIALTKSGSKILVPYEMYGTTIQLIDLLQQKFDVKKISVYPDTKDIIEEIKRSGPDIVFIETITNPTLRIFDVPEIAKTCNDLGCSLIVDNTFATPILYNPIEHDARIVIHSVTKYIAGHNDIIGGVVVVKNQEDLNLLWDWRRILGGIMQPFEAYMAIRGVKTLKIRFEKTSNSAKAIAEFLKDHSAVKEVYYPGLDESPYKPVADKMFKQKIYGGVVSFEVRGGASSVDKILRKVKIIKPSPSLGGSESLLTYPIISASKYIPEEIRKRLGITDGLLRLSVGLEDTEDLIEDLSQALSTI
jgi:cystathionine gamma-synthase